MSIEDVTEIVPEVSTITPFQKLVLSIGEIPTNYLDSMSYAEQVTWFCMHLQEKVLPAVNQQSEKILEIINYLNNLDLQDEVNNKLDEMVESGELLELLQFIKPNENFDLGLGMTTFFHNLQDSGASELVEIKKYYSKLIQGIRLSYDTTTEQFEIQHNNFNLEVENINNYINNGGNIEGIKFFITGTKLNELITSYGAEVIFTKYLNKINNIIDNLPYKNQFIYVWCFNEIGNSVLIDDNASYIINILETIHNKGYLTSICYQNAYAMTDTDQNILLSNDFLSLNCYPFNDVYGSKSSIKDVAERFNKEYRIIERYLQNKQLYITEFGCSSSWTSFNNPPQYVNNENGKPISLMIEGFYQSDFINNIIGCALWYYKDAYMYSNSTLSSIKYNTEVRYNE